jgi:tRNA pseudouridine13 synthase
VDIADFIVREITPNREILSIRERDTPEISFDGKKDRYTTFILIKRNTDTIYAARVIADYLQMQETEIMWAGIKDNAAITAQRFAVPGNQVKLLQKFRAKNIILSNIRPSHKGVDVGQLWGNNFEINVRKLNHPFKDCPEIINEWQNQILQNGFPNFYGLQRFGQHRPNSQKIGKFLFLREYDHAVEEFLFAIYPDEYAPISDFRTRLADSYQNNQKPSEWHPGLYYEQLIYKKLMKNPVDFVGALNALPKALLNLIYSAYQSYLFNCAISARIQQKIPLGSPIRGDLVSILTEKWGSPTLVTYRFGGWNDDAILKAFKHNRATILAPVLGYQTDLTRFPVFQQLYKSILAEEQFPLYMFQNGLTGYFNFKGTVRPILQTPTDLGVDQAYMLNAYPQRDDFGVKISFSLPKGTYATMLIRELTKTKEN